MATQFITSRRSISLFICMLLAVQAYAEPDVKVPADPRVRRQLRQADITFEGGQRIAVSLPTLPVRDDVCRQIAADLKRLMAKGSILDMANFDRWVFCDDPVELRVELLDLMPLTAEEAACKARHLTDIQRKKLHLAGRGDIKRLFDQADERRRQFENDRQKIETGFAALCRLDELLMSYQRGPFGSGSLFAKTLKKIESDTGTPRK